jgi:hypothetical protein
MFLYHLAHERFEEALHEARRIYSPHVLYGHVAIAIAAGELGRTEEAGEAVARIRAIDGGYGDRLIADLRSRNLHPELIGRVVRGLRKAGLRGRDLNRVLPASPGSASADAVRSSGPANRN